MTLNDKRSLCSLNGKKITINFGRLPLSSHQTANAIKCHSLPFFATPFALTPPPSLVRKFVPSTNIADEGNG